MFVPVWMIVATGIVIALLLLWGLARGRRSDDMLSRQRAATPPPPRQVPPQDDAPLMALPEVAEALRRGNKIEAIKHVRAASALGLKEAKELVERNS